MCPLKKRPPIKADLSTLFNVTKPVLHHTYVRYNNRPLKGFIKRLRPEEETIKRVNNVETATADAESVNVYSPKRIAIDPKNKLIYTRKTATTLQQIIDKLFSNKQITQEKLAYLSEIFAKLARAISRMHNIGRTHGDISISNVIINRNRVGLLDFELSRKRKINWQDYKDIFRKTENDVGLVLDELVELQLYGVPQTYIEQEAKKFILRVIARYPCSHEIKQRLFEHYFKYTLQRARYVRAVRLQAEYLKRQNETTTKS